MNKHKFEYFLIRKIDLIARVVSLKTAHHIGDLIGDLFYFIIRTRKQVALTNLKQTFSGEKSEKELKQILRNNYRHFGRVLMEFARMPLFNRNNVLQQIPIHNIEYIEELINQQNGVLILTGHFGNWEYLAAALANIGPQLYCVFKQQKNLAVDNIIKQLRIDIGLLPLKVKGGAASGVIRALKQKEMALIVIDQDAGKKGKFIDFLGRPASTTDGAAAIAIRYNIPVILAFGIRGKNGLIKVFLHKFLDVNKLSDNEEGRIQFLKEYNKILEKYIRKYPEQWFWLHRRWKTRPAE